MKKQILKIIILFLCLIVTSFVYTTGLFNEMQNEIDNMKNLIELYHTNETNVDSPNSDPPIENNAATEEDIVSDLDILEDAPKTSTSKKVSTSSKPNVTTKPSTYNNGIYEDMRADYYGRLYIPDLNISVALYYGASNSITDRTDSANIYFGGHDEGFTIADHNHQEFAKLLGVKVGMMGYIERDIGRENIKCVDVFGGHNTGYDIIDENGTNAANRTDYMMYTCKNNSKNVLICLWETV